MSRRRSFFESSNPVMTEKAFQQSAGTLVQGGETMTVNGAVNKTLILTGILLLTTVFSYANPNPILMWGGAIGGFIVVIFSVFKPQYSKITAPIYAALEGLFVGGISAIYAAAFNGIIFQAVSITMAILFMMLFLYKSGIIKVTKSFRTGVIMATGAVFLVYLVSMVLRMFGIQIPFLHSGGMIGIGISVVIIGIASLNLLLDFDNFEKGEQYGAPTYMEWFSAMGLLITLIWLYLEVLRLVAMLSGRD
jgi:uncharacterized YccA/Bax inhibitor family protein